MSAFDTELPPAVSRSSAPDVLADFTANPAAARPFFTWMESGAAWAAFGDWYDAQAGGPGVAAVNYDLPHCGALWPNRGPAGGRWTCTLDRGHGGDHEAYSDFDQPPFSRASQDDDEITWDAS